MTFTRKEIIGDATLYLGDCLPIMESMKENEIDAVVTDPPYGIGFSYNTYDDTSDGYSEWCSLWFRELQRLCRVVAISPGIANIAQWPQPDWVLCWAKPAAMGRCMIGFNTWEPVFIYGKCKGRVNTDMFKAPIIPDKSVGIHPCPKPLKWAMEITVRVAGEEETIIDPFMGSGTTGVACHRLGHKFIGVEQDAEYFDIACKRIEQAQRQANLF